MFTDYFGSDKLEEKVKNWKDYKANSHGDACVKALDEWCNQITEP